MIAINLNNEGLSSIKSFMSIVQFMGTITIQST